MTWNQEPLRGIVEKYTQSFFVIYLPKLKIFVDVVPAYINTPVLNKNHALELKYFMESNTLSREVTLDFVWYNHHSTQFICEIKINELNLIDELVRNGWAKLN